MSNFESLLVAIDSASRRTRLVLAMSVVHCSDGSLSSEFAGRARVMRDAVDEWLFREENGALVSVSHAFDAVQVAFLEDCETRDEGDARGHAWMDLVYVACYCMLWEVYSLGWESGGLSSEDLPSTVAEGGDDLWEEMRQASRKLSPDELAVFGPCVVAKMTSGL